MHQIWVWLRVPITMAFDRYTRWFEENTRSARVKDPRSLFSEPSGVLEDDGPRPTHLANVCAEAFSTWDTVHHSIPMVGWYWVLGVHKPLPQGPETGS